jgi:hypothetical protein
MSTNDPNAELVVGKWGGRRQGKTINAAPLYLQRREAAERVRIARTMATAFPSEENAAELVAAMEAFRRLTGREGEQVRP